MGKWMLFMCCILVGMLPVNCCAEGLIVDTDMNEEICTVDLEVSFAEGENGELVPIVPGEVQPRTNIDDQGGTAVIWHGRLVYSRVTVNGLSCIKPLTYSHMVEVIDDDYVVTKLTATGGAGGWGYHTNNNNAGGSYTMGPISLNQSNPVSGRYYTKSLNNPGYALYMEIAFNSSCSFKYYRVTDSQQQIKTSTTYRIEYGN